MEKFTFKSMLLLLLVPALCLSTLAFAQSGATVSGKVTDADNTPLAQVSVNVQGGSTGVVTDVNGNFTITANRDDVLIFSYVGYSDETARVSDGEPVIIRMQQSNSSSNLEGVVVVGYGTQRARNVTGAVGRVGAREIRQVAVVSADQAILGRVAGVQVTQNSGEPGGEISIRIRGIASITSGSDPLIVVDGIPMSVNLRAINPNDIESIDILKDAAASAIYGSRASAGVILITTKRGKAGKVTVSVDAYTGMQKVPRKIPVLNGPEFAKLANENLVNAGQEPNPAWSNPSSMPTTNWQDAIFRTAPMNNYNETGRYYSKVRV
jgi:TonB-dependent SusC/RagA subfamily outer membrane receptor